MLLCSWCVCQTPTPVTDQSPPPHTHIPLQRKTPHADTLPKQMPLPKGTPLPRHFIFATYLPIQSQILNNSTLYANLINIINIIFFRHLDETGKIGFSLILMDMFVTAKYDLCVWDYCKQNFLLTVVIPKCICVSMRIFNIGPMRKYSSYMLFLMQTRLVCIIISLRYVSYSEM